MKSEFLKAPQVSVRTYYVWETLACCLLLRCLRKAISPCVCLVWSESMYLLPQEIRPWADSGAGHGVGSCTSWRVLEAVLRCQHTPSSSIAQSSSVIISILPRPRGSHRSEIIPIVNQRAVKSCSWDGGKSLELIDCSTKSCYPWSPRKYAG